MGKFATILLTLMGVIVLLLVLPLMTSLATTGGIDSLQSKLENYGIWAYSVGALTDTRVPFVDGDDLTDDANFTYDSATDTLSVTNVDAPTGRTATYVIAASDAPSHVKAQADYVCDGTADNVEIQAAIDALGTDGGRVLLSSGNYTIAGSILVDDLVTIAGQDESSILTLVDSATCNIFNAIEKAGWTIKNIRLEGNSSNTTYVGQSTLNGIYITGKGPGNSNSEVSRCYINNVHINDFDGDGVYASGIQYTKFDKLIATNNKVSGLHITGGASYGSQYNTLVNCRITGNTKFGLYLQYISTKNANTDVVACDFLYNGDGATTGSGNLYANSGVTTYKFSSCHFNHGNYYGAYIISSTGMQFVNCDFMANSRNGIYLTNNADGNLIQACRFGINSAASANNYSDIILRTGGGPDHPSGNIISGCTLSGATVKYNIEEDNYDIANTHQTDNIIIGNNISSRGISYPDYSYGLANNNQGYIFPSEIRTASVPYVAGNVGAIAMSWHNPEAQDIYITKIVVKDANDATLAATAALGVADDAAGTNLGAEFFTAIPLDSADGTVFDSWVAGDTGAQTKWIALQDSASATDGWLNMQIAAQNSDGTGTVYITYCGQ